MADGASEANGRSHRATAIAIVALVAVVALVLIEPGLRSLAAATWRELRGISLPWLALIVLARIGQAIFSAICWRNALNAAFPRAPLPLRLVLGLDQGQDALNTLTPARGGTITLIATLRLMIRGATTPKLLGVLAIQNLPFLVFGLILAAVLAIGLPDRARDDSGLLTDITEFARNHPLWTGLTIVVLIGGALVALYLARARIDQARKELRDGLALLGSPGRYVRLVGLPAFASYAFRWVGTIGLLAAFGIPVTFWTAALAIGSNAASGAIRVTPGGVGPTQAVDVIALGAYASAETVTAFSLAGLAVSAVVSTVLALFGLLTAGNGKGLRAMLRARRKTNAG